MDKFETSLGYIVGLSKPINIMQTQRKRERDSKRQSLKHKGVPHDSHSEVPK